MSYKQLVTPNPMVPCRPGWCLAYVQDAFNTAHLYANARIAWEQAKFKHTDRPTGIWVPIYFDDKRIDEDHIAVLAPDGSVYSSSSATSTVPTHHSSIDDTIKAYGYNLVYRGWSEELAGTIIVKEQGDIMDKETVNLMYLFAEIVPANEFRLNYWNGKPTKELAKALYEVDNKPVREKIASIPAKDNEISALKAEKSNLTSLLATEKAAKQKAEQLIVEKANALVEAEKALQSKDAEIVELKKQAEIDNQNDIEEALKSIKKQEELTAELRAQEIINKTLEEKQKADDLACIKDEQSVSIVTKFIKSIMKLLNRKGK
jgi:hypothetical protein